MLVAQQPPPFPESRFFLPNYWDLAQSCRDTQRGRGSPPVRPLAADAVFLPQPLHDDLFLTFGLGSKERDNFWPHLVQSLKISSDVDFLEIWWTTNIPRHASSNSSNTSYFAPKAQISSGPKQLNVCRRKAWGTKVIPTGSHYVWTLFLLEKIPIVLRLADVCWANLETLDVGPKLRVAQVAPGAKPPGIWVLWRNTSFPAKACGMQHVWSSCGCQTTLSLNTIFMPIMDNSITQRICNRSLASTTHPQKNMTKTLSPPKKIHREWGFLVRNLRNDESIPGVRVERLDFTSVRVALQREFYSISSVLNIESDRVVLPKWCISGKKWEAPDFSWHKSASALQAQGESMDSFKNIARSNREMVDSLTWEFQTILLDLHRHMPIERSRTTGSKNLTLVTSLIYQ